jgi:TRAP-type C4-dicarboxylate transport system substrate-binding protein
VKKPTIREAKEAAQVFSRMGNHARWKGTTPEQRKAATAKATEARRKQAKLRKEKITP